jgi:hypothetical protein
MSRTTTKRLEQIAVSLTPEQAMLHFLQEAQQFPSLPALVLHYRDLPESQWPLYHLHDQVEHAITQALKGQDRVRMDQALREAHREVYFRFYLFTGLNARFMQEKRALWLLTAFVSGGLIDVVYGDRAERWETWRERLEYLVAEVLMWEGAWARIKARYYEGQEVLMPEAVSTLTGLVEQSTYLVELFNQWADALQGEAKRARKRKTAGVPELLEVEDIRRRTTDSTNLEYARIVDLAKAEACEAVGERARALAFAGRHAFG